MSDYIYVGKELELFLNARNWKSYWLSVLQPYVRGDVADIGAGIGATLLAGHDRLSFDTWTAVEPDLSLYEALESNLEQLALPSTEAIHGTIADTTRQFDTILYIDVIEHIEDDRAELERSALKLKERGRVITITPAHNFLFSEFDRHVGHYRRYDKTMLENLKPKGLRLEKVVHLDAVGMILSAANRFVLKSSLPTPGQIHFWDHAIVPLSRLLDPLTGYRLGKTVLGVWAVE